MVRGIHHAAAALCFVLRVFAVAVLYHDGLVIGEQQHVAPFADQRSHLFGRLHSPAVVLAHFIGLLKFRKFRVGGHDYVVPGVQYTSSSRSRSLPNSSSK